MKRKLIFFALLFLLISAVALSAYAELTEMPKLTLDTEIYSLSPYKLYMDEKLNGSVKTVLYEIAAIKYQFGVAEPGPKRKLIEITFDNQGRRVADVLYRYYQVMKYGNFSSIPATDEVIGKVNYKYDNSGRLVLEETVDQNPNNHSFYPTTQSNYSLKYTYGENGRISLVESPNAFIPAKIKYNYQYDDKGRIIELTVVHQLASNEILLLSKKYRYDDTKNEIRLISKEGISSDETGILYKLNAQNQVIEEIEYNSGEEALSSRSTYQYDSFSNIVKKISYGREIGLGKQTAVLTRIISNNVLKTDSNGNPVELHIISEELDYKTKKKVVNDRLVAVQEYTYDANGNWTSKKFSRVEYDNATKKPKFIPLSVIYRTITY